MFKRFNIWHLNMFLNIRPYGPEISKLYSYGFHPNSARLYEDIGYHAYGGIQVVTLLGNWPSFKAFVTIWNFYMRVNGNILKYAIFWKRLLGEQSGKKLGNRGCMNSIRRVLLIVRFFEFNLGLFGADFKRLLLPQFSPSFNQTLWKVWQSAGIQAICQM